MSAVIVVAAMNVCHGIAGSSISIMSNNMAESTQSAKAVIDDTCCAKVVIMESVETGAGCSAFLTSYDRML